MLFHDIAKPLCKTTDEEGTDHFYGHPEESARLAEQIFDRLKFDRATKEQVCALVRWHDYNPALTQKAVRRAIAKVGILQYPAIFEVKRADILAQSLYLREEKLSYLDEYERIYEEIMSRKDCLSLKDLAVTGNDLMELGVPQGKQIGILLRRLLELVIEEPGNNDRKLLLGKAKAWLEAGDE